MSRTVYVGKNNLHYLKLQDAEIYGEGCVGKYEEKEIVIVPVTPEEQKSALASVAEEKKEAEEAPAKVLKEGFESMDDKALQAYARTLGLKAPHLLKRPTLELKVKAKLAE